MLLNIQASNAYTTLKPSPQSTKELITLHKDVHGCDTRHKNDIHAEHINYVALGSKKLNYRGINFWNNLSLNLKQETLTNKFKKI